MMNKLKAIDVLLRKKGINIQKQIEWLKRSGITEEVALETIAEMYTHLKNGGKDHLNPENYPKKMHHLFEKKELPEHFWIDRLILEKCKKKMEDVLAERLNKNASATTHMMANEMGYYMKMLTIWIVASGSITIIFGSISRTAIQIIPMAEA